MCVYAVNIQIVFVRSYIHAIANDHCVVPLVGLQRDLLLRLQFLCLHLLDLTSKHLLRLGC